MVIYPYECNSCNIQTEVIKSVKAIEDLEHCKDCGGIMKRYIATAGHFYGAAVEESEWNHGLGCVTKNKKHRAEMAKRKGCEEVGNFDTKRQHKDDARASELRNEARWEKV